MPSGRGCTWLLVSFSALLLHPFLKSTAAVLMSLTSSSVGAVLICFFSGSGRHASMHVTSGDSSMVSRSVSDWMQTPGHSSRFSLGCPVVHCLHLLLESSDPPRRAPWPRWNSRSLLVYHVQCVVPFWQQPPTCPFCLARFGFSYPRYGQVPSHRVLQWQGMHIKPSTKSSWSSVLSNVETWHAVSSL